MFNLIKQIWKATWAEGTNEVHVVWADTEAEAQYKQYLKDKASFQYHSDACECMCCQQLGDNV